MAEFIRNLLPTLILFSVLAWEGIENPRIYTENFGDPANYLTFSFERHPSAEQIRFSGRWTTDHEDRRILGEKRVSNRSTQYVMDLPEGRFVGNLQRNDRGCEPLLFYTIEKGGVLVKHGKLRGAFCL